MEAVVFPAGLFSRLIPYERVDIARAGDTGVVRQDPGIRVLHHRDRQCADIPAERDERQQRRS